MKLVLRNEVNEYIKSISFKKFEISQKFLAELELHIIKHTSAAHLITTNEKVNSFDLEKLKINLEKLNINFSHIYSSSRETVLSGKSLKINSTFLDQKNIENELFISPTHQQKGIIHNGTVRSGDRISSNGDLFIIGDVNPGAIISANNNIYVWGRLLGNAFAGENGNIKASIASLYLNPLQLRICEIIAIGPKEKPKHRYPEVAILENKKIIIKPYLSKSSLQ